MQFSKCSLEEESSHTQIRLKPPSGEYNWYDFTSRSIYNELGEVHEIFWKIKNIHREIEKEADYTQMNQYFKKIQSLSGEETELQLRIINVNGTYQWYELFNIIVHTDEGEVSEILGRIKNIQRSHALEEENSQLALYFAAFQELSNDYLCRIDMKEKTLHHLAQFEGPVKVGQIVPNYINTLIKEKMIHPEDVKTFRLQSNQWLKGNVRSFRLRTFFNSDTYVWSEISGQ